MAAVVNVFVRDDSTQHTPIYGATVAIVLPPFYVFNGLVTSDQHGMAGFLLPEGLYEIRCFKLGVVFKNPVAIQVVEDGLPNEFDVSGTLLGPYGVPADSRLCRCVGRFLDYSRQPVVNAMVRIATSMDLLSKQPKVVDGNMILPSAMVRHTDENGYLVVDLLRGGGYWVALAGEEDELWNFLVPDCQTVNLIDLIHPYPVTLSWGSSSVNVSPNQSVQVPFSVVFSDYQTRSAELQELLQFMNSDDSIIDLAYQASGSVVITGKVPGTATVTAETKADLFPKRVPDYSLTAPALPVTVTP